MMGEDPLRNLDPGGEISSSGGLAESCGGSVETAGECAVCSVPPCPARLSLSPSELAWLSPFSHLIQTRINSLGILIMSSS